MSNIAGIFLSKGLYMSNYVSNGFRYKALGFPVTEAVETTAENCEKILHSAYIHGYEIGKTKVLPFDISLAF